MQSGQMDTGSLAGLWHLVTIASAGGSAFERARGARRSKVYEGRVPQLDIQSLGLGGFVSFASVSIARKGSRRPLEVQLPCSSLTETGMSVPSVAVSLEYELRD